jgi:hypothetical protein
VPYADFLLNHHDRLLLVTLSDNGLTAPNPWVPWFSVVVFMSPSVTAEK